MSLGVIGRKRGMTRVFTEDGAGVPVTVIEVLPNRVAQLRTSERDGYLAVQLATGARRASRITKAVAGHLAKAEAGAVRMMREFRLSEAEAGELELGKEVGADIFSVGQKVDVTGRSIGKGFAGTVKRHHFHMQDATHGNSLSHRVHGSVGQNQTPGRVFKGKRMAGHLGAVRRTQQNLEVVRVDAERNLLLVKGAVPGAAGADLLVRPAVKARG
ncbi:MAG: 50S ribosomal protein L3 [Gammaproteobacteria bacterium]